MMKLLAIAAAVLCSAAQGQQTARIRTIVPHIKEPYVAGVPLSAVEVLDFVPAEGAPTGVAPEHVEDTFYRDSEGRTREEIRPAGFAAWIFLVDPVANASMSWREGTRDVKMTKLQVRTQDGPDSHAEFVSGESERQIEGFAARRTTGGRAMNLRPQDRMIETWYSPELHLDLLQVVEEPGVGRSTYAYRKITRGEPNAALFVPPARPTLLEGPATKELPPGVLRIGNGVSPPLVLSAPDPEFSKQARKDKVSGSVLVYLQVDETGTPLNLRVIRGVGHGLDEKALEAVTRYKFKPAMKDGQPVKVEMNVQVNFQIFTKP